jgi:hypothetical protein
MKRLALSIPLILTTAVAQDAADRAIATTQGAPRFRGSIPSDVLIREVKAQRIPELYPGEIEDVGPQFLVARPGATAADGKGGPAPAVHHWFEGFADVQFYRTSNALLTEKGNSDTGVMVLTAQASFNAQPISIAGGELVARAGYRHQWWLYSLDSTANQLNNFDFAVATVFAGFRHSWNDVWVASLSLDYNRYLSLENDNAEFYVELAPNWSLERNFGLGEKGQITLGYYGAYHWTQTDPAPVKHINDRLDSALGVAATFELMPRLFAQPFFRFQWSHYTENSDRNDIYNTIGLGLVYVFNDWASMRTFISYENRNSTDDTVSDYGKWDAGGGVTFSAKF